jgi:hypothetical protein
MQKPMAPPSLNARDLKLAYAEFGDPEKNWIDVRVGRQLINYNNTILSESECAVVTSNAVVTSLHYDRYRPDLFAASAVVPLAGAPAITRRATTSLAPTERLTVSFPNSDIEPFVLWPVQPSVTIEKAAEVKTGK